MAFKCKLKKIKAPGSVLSLLKSQKTSKAIHLSVCPVESLS